LEDVDGDGDVDILDVDKLFRERNSDAVQENPDAFDFNGDSEVDILDVDMLFREEIE
jgi:hypothetical protein